MHISHILGKIKDVDDFMCMLVKMDAVASCLIDDFIYTEFYH